MSKVDVDYDQLIEFMTKKKDKPEEKKTILVDVRNADELVNDGKIVGSFNVPLPEISSAFQLDKEKFRLKYGFDLLEKDTENLILSCKYLSYNTNLINHINLKFLGLE